MRYSASRPQSAELLRLALAKMGQHDAAFNPITFAVWYEHVAGINPRLSEALEQSLKLEPKLGDETIQRLHRAHVADIDAAAAERVSGDFRRVMQSLSESAARTGDSASAFGEKLGALNRSLETADRSALATQVGDALAGTAEMRSSIEALRSQVSASQNEIEQLRADLQRTRLEAMLCPLTHVLNRKGFDQALQVLVAPASKAPACLVMIDIDHFKQVNDTHGHLMGDRVLQALGEILRRTVGDGDASAARYGGEEFALLLPGSTVAKAAELAEAVLAGVRRMRVRQRNTDKIILTVTVSAGVAALLPGDDAAAIISRADAALYRSKQAGRDRVTTA